MWYLIENEKQYKKAVKRFELLYYLKTKETKLLAVLINQYEEKKYSFNSDPVEIIKSRMDDLSVKVSDLPFDKGTISKVLNYKQGLSLNMIRELSKMLRVRSDLLIKEYELK